MLDMPIALRGTEAGIAASESKRMHIEPLLSKLMHQQRMRE